MSENSRQPEKKKVKAWPFIVAALVVIAAVVVIILCTRGGAGDDARETGVQAAIDNGKVINIAGVDCALVGSSLVVYNYTGEGGEVGIPNQIGNQYVTGIATGAFSGCESMTSVLIPAEITFISENAFSGCKNLTDVYYFGTQAQWDALEIASGNGPLESAKLNLVEPAAE